MSEDIKAGEAEVEVEVNPVEDQAREQGWVNKDEWEKSGRDAVEWRPAKEFVERGEIFKSLHQVKRELKGEKAAREALQKHHQYVYEKAYQKAYNDLKVEKRAAIKAEDFQKLEEVEEKIEDLQKERQQEVAVATQQQQAAAAANSVHPEFQVWVDKNTWFNTDSDMREFAEAVAQIYINKNPGAQPTDVLRHTETKVRKQFSEKFGQRRAAPNAVAGVDRTSSRNTGSEVILNEMEMQIMKTLVASGDLTEAQYKAEIKKARETK